MLEQAFPNFVKKNRSLIFYIMENDKVAILTMTTHEDSKKEQSNNSRSKWKDQKGQKGYHNKQQSFEPSSSFPQKKSWFKSYVCYTFEGLLHLGNKHPPLLQGRCTHAKPSFFTAFWMWTRLYLLSQKLQCLNTWRSRQTHKPMPTKVVTLLLFKTNLFDWRTCFLLTYWNRKTHLQLYPHETASCERCSIISNNVQ